MMPHADEGWHEEKCPHIHFSTSVINRDNLTKKQHLNLLCTPKGYRWEILRRENLEGVKNGFKEVRGFEDENESREPKQTYVQDFLKDIWSALDEPMIKRLLKMLMKELCMSKEEAENFMCQQKMKVMRYSEQDEKYIASEDNNGIPDDARGKLKHKSKKNTFQKDDYAIKLDPCRVNDIAKAVTEKLSDYAANVVCAKRDRRQRTTAKVILKNMSKFFGEDCSFIDVQNRLHKILAFSADRLAILLNSTVAMVSQKKQLQKDQKKK